MMECIYGTLYIYEKKTNYSFPEVFLNILDLKSWAWKVCHKSRLHCQIVEIVHLKKAREQ